MKVFAVILFTATHWYLADFPTRDRCLAAYHKNLMVVNRPVDPDECAEPMDAWKVEWIQTRVKAVTFSKE